MSIQGDYLDRVPDSSEYIQSISLWDYEKGSVFEKEKYELIIRTNLGGVSLRLEEGMSIENAIRNLEELIRLFKLQR